MSKTSLALKWSAESVMDSHHSAFWTITTAEPVPYVEFRAMWREAIRRLRKLCPSLKGVRVFEVHPDEYSHGLHAHMVVTRYFDFHLIHSIFGASGFGRCWVEWVKDNSRMSSYLAKYLTKQVGQRPAALRGWRMWASVGFDSYIRVSQVRPDTVLARLFRHCYKERESFQELAYRDKLACVYNLYFAVLLDEFPLPGPLGEPGTGQAPTKQRIKLRKFKASTSSRPAFLGGDLSRVHQPPIFNVIERQHFAIPHPSGKNSGVPHPYYAN